MTGPPDETAVEVIVRNFESLIEYTPLLLLRSSPCPTFPIHAPYYMPFA